MGKDNVRSVDNNENKKGGSVLTIVLIVLAVIIVSAVAGFFLSGPILDRFPELKNGFNPNAATQLFYVDGTVLATCDGGEDRVGRLVGIGLGQAGECGDFGDEIGLVHGDVLDGAVGKG